MKVRYSVTITHERTMEGIRPLERPFVMRSTGTREEAESAIAKISNAASANGLSAPTCPQKFVPSGRKR